MAKSSDLDGIPSELWKTKSLNDTLLTFCNNVYNLGKLENYIGITLTPIAAKIYNPMLLN